MLLNSIIVRKSERNLPRFQLRRSKKASWRGYISGFVTHNKLGPSIPAADVSHETAEEGKDIVTPIVMQMPKPYLPKAITKFLRGDSRRCLSLDFQECPRPGELLDFLAS